MRVAWAILVAWCMVVASTERANLDRTHKAGISKPAGFHHPLRHRDMPGLAPFVEVVRDEMTVPPRAAKVFSITSADSGVIATTVSLVARGPPVA